MQYIYKYMQYIYNLEILKWQILEFWNIMK